MTDRQFQSWVCFLLGDLKDLEQESDLVKQKAKLKEIMDNLQKTLED